MGKIVRLGGLVVLGFGFAIVTQVARADFTVTVEAKEGGSKLNVLPGEKFSLDVVFANPDPAEVFDMFAFYINFDKAGLEFQGYDYIPDYFEEGGQDDYVSPTPPGVIADYLYLTNLSTEGNAFGTGGTTAVLVNLDLRVPDDFQALGKDFPINIQFKYDEFVYGGIEYEPVAGTKFLLNVVPEPATLVLLGFAGLVALRRRRSA